MAAIKKIQKQHHYCKILENELCFAKKDLLELILPFIINDTDIKDEDVYVEYLAGDGFGLMIGEVGLSISEIISMIEPLRKGEKIKLSELDTYL